MIRDNLGRFTKGHNRGYKNRRYNPDLHIIEKTECKCGCGGYVEHPKSKPRKFIWGHNIRTISKADHSNRIIKAHKELLRKKDKNGRVTPFYKLIKESKLYKKWRKSVFERDNYTCQKCKVRGEHLHAHHIKPFSSLYRILYNKALSYKELYNRAECCRQLWETSNGVTLCQPCHGTMYHSHYVLARQK